MDLKNLKDIIQLFERSSLSKMTIKEKGGNEVTLEKQRETSVETTPTVAVPCAPAPRPLQPSPLVVPKEEEDYYVVKSPMVGTFYRSSSPEEKPYVQEGDQVQADTVVCIIEAMKVMNEVKAGKAGVVKSFHTNDGAPVEFNSRLISIG